jgi:pyruvate formate lyase activating enzyme
MGSPAWEEKTPEDLAALSLLLAHRGNIGIAYTYNEPLIGIEFVLDCARLIREQGQKSVL